MIPRSARDLEQSTPNERPFMKFVSRTKSMAVPHQIHTYTELRQQIHDDLPIQHPEWVEPNGESLMCLMELLDSLTKGGSNESIATPHRAFEQGLNRLDTWRCNTSGGKLELPAHVPFYVLLAFTTLALASPCQAQHRGTSRQHNFTPQQALDKRQDAFQGDKAKGVHASY